MEQRVKKSSRTNAGLIEEIGFLKQRIDASTLLLFARNGTIEMSLLMGMLREIRSYNVSVRW